MTPEEFDRNVCQAGGMPLSSVAMSLGINVLPEGITLTMNLTPTLIRANVLMGRESPLRDLTVGT